MRIIIVISLLLVSCIHEESTDTISVLKNNTSHKIRITPYDDGKPLTEEVVEINENASVEALFRTYRGKGTGLFYANYLTFMDSVEVRFDDRRRSIHMSYALNSTVTNSNAIRYDSNRSLFNEKNYNRRILAETRNHITNEYTFTFTDEDYQAAR